MLAVLVIQHFLVLQATPGSALVLLVPTVWLFDSSAAVCRVHQQAKLSNSAVIVAGIVVFAMW